MKVSDLRRVLEQDWGHRTRLWAPIIAQFWQVSKILIFSCLASSGVKYSLVLYSSMEIFHSSLNNVIQYRTDSEHKKSLKDEELSPPDTKYR